MPPPGRRAMVSPQPSANALLASVAQYTSPGDRNILQVSVEDNGGAGVDAGYSLMIDC